MVAGRSICNALATCLKPSHIHLCSPNIHLQIGFHQSTTTWHNLALTLKCWKIKTLKISQGAEISLGIEDSPCRPSNILGPPHSKVPICTHCFLNHHKRCLLLTHLWSNWIKILNSYLLKNCRITPQTKVQDIEM